MGKWEKAILVSLLLFLFNNLLAENTPTNTLQPKPVEQPKEQQSTTPSVIIHPNSSTPPKPNTVKANVPSKATELPPIPQPNTIAPPTSSLIPMLLPSKVFVPTPQLLIKKPSLPPPPAISTSPLLKTMEPSHLVNQFTQTNIRGAILQNQQFTHEVNNARWIQRINSYGQLYKTELYPGIMERSKLYTQSWQKNAYKEVYSAWYKWGFYGGFQYPIRVAVDLENYFTYPTVQWLFVDEDLSQYYKGYYSLSAHENNDCYEPFTYKHIYFPTDTLRDLLVEASNFRQDSLCNFRLSLLNMTNQLRQNISNQSTTLFTPQANDIVINFYKNLRNQGIWLSGFINQGKINVPFEVFLDLEDPNKSITFTPNGHKPTDKQLQMLYKLNTRIRDLGGDPYTAKKEPTTANDDLQNMLAEQGADLSL